MCGSETAVCERRKVYQILRSEAMARCRQAKSNRIVCHHFLSHPEFPMRGFVKSVRLRRTPSLPPSHLVRIRILSRRRGVGCLLKSVFRLPLMPRTHRSECRNAVTGTGCKLTLDRRPSSTFAAFSNQNPSLHFRSFLSKSQIPSSYSRLVHHVPIRILSR